jgi:hypothetical protein
MIKGGSEMSKQQPWLARVRLRRLTSFVVVCLVLTTMSGCGYFRAQRRINLMPFAESTITLAGDVQVGLGSIRPVYINEHVRGPAVESVRQNWLRVRRILNGIMAYSVEIVALSESRLGGKERGEALADYLAGLTQPAFAQPRPELHISDERLSGIIADVRNQSNMLDALNAAQPIIDEVARLTDQLIEEILTNLTIADKDITNNIMNEHAGLLQYADVLKDAQIDNVREMVLLRRYRSGDVSALPELLESDVSMREFIGSPDTLTNEDRLAVENRLIHKLTVFRQVQEQLSPELELYHKQMRELEDIFRQSESASRKARVAVLVWSRAHRRMAAGITDPARINVFDLSKKAIDMAL